MYPQTHFLASFFIALAFLKLDIISGFNYWHVFYVALVGLAVDIDHYITFLIKYKYKDFSLKDAWNRAVKGMYRGRSFVHHSIGIFIVTGILLWLFFNYRILFWIFALGYYSHLLVDYAHLNVLKIREKMTFREMGFFTRINKFEVLLDLFLIVGIILLLI